MPLPFAWVVPAIWLTQQGDGTSTYGTITGLIHRLGSATGRSVLATGANANSGVSGRQRP